MLNLKTKKIVAAVVAVAFVFSAFVGLTSSSASAQSMVGGYTFNMNLTVGSTGPDVVALQSILVANGYLVMPAGVSMGYFGGLTKTALGAWQAANGISPSAGYFGPITRAYFNTHVMTGGSTQPPSGGSTVPGCTSTVGFSPLTGQSCAGSASSVPGCTSTVGYSPINGQSCAGGTTTPPPASSTGEGTLTITQGPPGSNSNIQLNSDVPVYGLQLRAQLGDVRVDRIDLDVMDTITGGSIENPGNFVNRIKVMDGSTVLLDRSVSTADFITGTSSTDYYIRLSGLNFMVPSGSTKVLSVAFSTSGSIDSNRTLVIRGYGASSLLSYSGANNTASYYDISGMTTTQVFQKPGNSTLIVGIDQSNPLSMTNYVDINNGSQNVPLLSFTTNTTQGSSRVTQVVATVKTALVTSIYSGTSTPIGATSTPGTATVYPTGAHLFQGSQELQYRPITSTSSTLTFDNLDLSGSGTGSVYTIKVDMPANTANGTVASSTVTSVTYKNSNGNQQTSTSTVNGNQQYFFHATPQLAFTSADYIKTSNQSGQTTNVQVNFHFTMTPYPGQAAIPTASDFAVRARNGNTSATSTVLTSKGITITPNPTGVLGAQTYSIVLTANDSNAALSAGTYVYEVTAANTSVQDSNGSYQSIVQTWGFDNWHTDPVSHI